jgi:NifB/MoaA-like Fe-S oxidoreductase
MEYQPDLKNITGEGGVVASVEPGSIAAELGLAPGDVVVAVGEQRLRDVIDYRFAMAGEQIELLVRRGDDETIYEIEKDADEDLGIAFVEPLFERLRTCNNKCPFCFLTQMPKGLRRSLYLKDDDYRLGFLYGNFVTFTNLKEDDWHRIEEQRLSPQYISVHATERSLRAVLLGKPDVPDVLEQIRRLGLMGITVHTQIVALPELNDGPALHQSIRELAALYPVVQTIAVVPVGLTKYRFDGKRPQSIRAAIHIHETPEWIDTNWERQPLWDEAVRNAEGRTLNAEQAVRNAEGRTLNAEQAVRNAEGRTLNAEQAAAEAPPRSLNTTSIREQTFSVQRSAFSVQQELGYCNRQLVSADVPMRCYRPEEAARVIDVVEHYAAEFRREHGVGLVYASDEFYLLCERDLPPAAAYDGMPQYSNGLGMTRDFLDGWAKAQRRLPASLPRPAELTLVCGTLIAPTLQRVVDRLNNVGNLQARLLPVVNQFFGETVTVSGLLHAQDVIPALRDAGVKRALLPRVMFDHTGTRTLDEYTLDRIAAETGAALAIAGEPDEVVRYVRALAKDEV